VFAPKTAPVVGAVVALFVVGLAALAVTPGLRTPIGVGAVIVVGLVAAFFANFFRDPERVAGDGIVSGADGRIRAVSQEGERIRISVFMSVWDVHVNRFPLDARVTETDVVGEGYAPAYEASAEHNVRRVYRLETAIGPVELVQITGILARRLVPFVGAGDAHRKADRLGMIILGSRFDVLLPAARVTPVVRVGDRVHAGSTSIAKVVDG
jgi:phosphatidylserine decarboxylase